MEIQRILKITPDYVKLSEGRMVPYTPACDSLKMGLLVVFAPPGTTLDLEKIPEKVRPAEAIVPATGLIFKVSDVLKYDPDVKYVQGMDVSHLLNTIPPPIEASALQTDSTLKLSEAELAFLKFKTTEGTSLDLKAKLLNKKAYVLTALSGPVVLLKQGQVFATSGLVNESDPSATEAYTIARGLGSDDRVVGVIHNKTFYAYRVLDKTFRFSNGFCKDRHIPHAPVVLSAWSVLERSDCTSLDNLADATAFGKKQPGVLVGADGLDQVFFIRSERF